MSNNTRTARESEDPDRVKKDSLQILAQAITLRDGDFRMMQLLADFDKGNGFAKGWRMAVGECFRDSLDIKSFKQTDEAKDDVGGDKSVTKWTQGGAFSFSQGDTIYDTPRAYHSWDIAIKNICMAYQILQAAPSRPRKEITYLKRNTSFTVSLGGQTARRKVVVEAIPSDWTERNKIVETVKEATGKAASLELLQTLCDIQALDSRIDVEPRFPGVVRFQVLVPNTDRSKLCIKEEKVVSQDDFVALLMTGDKTKHNTVHSPGAHPSLLKH